MKLKQVEINDYSVGSFSGDAEGVTHVKELPVLSVVLATEGHYEVEIGGTEVILPEGGAFIAPPFVTQRIIHRNSPETGKMSAVWIFLDVTANRRFRLSDCYDFPVAFPAEKTSFLKEALTRISEGGSVCMMMSLIYSLIDILISSGTEKMPESDFNAAASDYIRLHCTERIKPSEMARALNLSLSTMFRRFASETGMTPSEFINRSRLASSAVLLETTDLTVTEIAQEVGLCDQPYYSKLFKRRFGLSPAAYRKSCRLK